jgi:hypothetical protein
MSKEVTEVMQLALTALEKSFQAYRGYGEYLSYVDVDASTHAIIALRKELGLPEWKSAEFNMEYLRKELVKRDHYRAALKDGL